MHTILFIDHDEGNRRAIGCFTDAGAASAFLTAALPTLRENHPTCSVDTDDTLLDMDGDQAVMLSAFVRDSNGLAVDEYHVVRVEEASIPNI